MKTHAFQILRAALNAADPMKAVLRHVKLDGRTLVVDRQRYQLADFDRIHVIGAGKASAAMASGLERVLGARISGGLLNVPDGTKTRLRRIEVNPSGHPIPDERGQSGALRMLDIARAAGRRDLLLCVISGGASALLPAPIPGLPLAAKRAITERLLKSGATIHEINTVRKHLSQIKGGRLAAAAAPAKVIGLILSDVIGDDLDVIGSGPTVPDRSTIQQASAILQKHRFTIAGDWETAVNPVTRLTNVQNVVVGSNRLAIDAAAKKARELRYHPLVLSTTIQGETREIALMHAAIAKEILANNRPAKRPACILSGGETTVTVTGAGRGGRNQEFVLAAAIALAKCGKLTILSAGTDGIDGPTDAAGAFADADTTSLGLDPQPFLENNDSYRFFEKVGGLIKTGPTGTNVMDIRMMLIP